MQDAIDAFLIAPPWAQAGMVLFAITAVVMLVGPSFRHRKFRRHFDAILRGLGQPPPSKGGWPVMRPVAVDGRTFEVRHDFRSTGGGGSYRGPTGYLLITATRLAGTRWPMHQVDISRLGGFLARLVTTQRLTGDPEFDARFLVVEDGLAVRDGWLDGALRAEIARFFDAAPLPGIVWVHEGELLFTMQDPWKRIDGPAVRTLLERQAELAAALERAAA